MQAHFEQITILKDTADVKRLERDLKYRICTANMPENRNEQG